jgi:hypothetical protein
MSIKKTIQALTVSAACAALLMFSAQSFAKATKSVEAKPAASQNVAVKTLVPQTTCPIMNNPIDKKQYVDYDGKRIYVCCAGCIAEVKKNPKAAIAKLEAMGQTPELLAIGKDSAKTAPPAK